MNDTLTLVLIVVGMVFVGGVISFVKQEMPKGVIVLLGVGAVMFIGLGVSRLLGQS